MEEMEARRKQEEEARRLKWLQQVRQAGAGRKRVPWRWLGPFCRGDLRAVSW